MKKIIAALFTSVALVFSTPTLAVDVSQLSVGVSGNFGVFVADGKEENYTHTGTLETTSEKHGAAFSEGYASLFVEVAVNDQVSIGLDYVPDAIETPQNVNSGEGTDDTTDIKVKAEFEELTTLYVLAKSDMGVYGKFGISTMNIDVTSENAGTYPDPGNTDGFMIGLGYEYGAGEGVAVRAELAYHEFDDVRAQNGQTDKNEITVSNMQGGTARVSLVKSF
ncbi:outer membrane protein [Candidatus Pelagibacter sp.]|uniref:outer membrane protein n=1 Tax=Candidatus Pelagibacter sp. TaxID=2024849 RepID=UPI003F836A23